MRTPVFLVDADGSLTYYNAPAAVLVGRPFEELGPMGATDWAERFDVRDRDGLAFPIEAMPGWISIQKDMPASGHIRFTGLGTGEHLVSISAFALFTQHDEFVGAFVNFFEEEDIQGERYVATAMFCDLRGFTAMSREVEPGLVREVLNIFYEEAGRTINEHRGTVLGCMGDEVFATWGARAGDTSGANEAVACARSLQERNTRLSDRLLTKGLPSIAYGVGMHTGDVIAAHVGFRAIVASGVVIVPGLRQFTVLGNTVNCASRLCSIAGRNEVVVSSDTYSVLDDQPPAEVLPAIRLKGVGRDLVPHRLWPEEFRDLTGEKRPGKVEVETAEAS